MGITDRRRDAKQIMLFAPGIMARVNLIFAASLSVNDVVKCFARGILSVYTAGPCPGVNIDGVSVTS